jgi:uncharacterized protein YdaU (DUF1376 family)
MSSPYFMFHPAEYLADTPHLTTEQHGAYLLLLINYWQRGKALDNSNERLSHVVKMPLDKWLEVKDSLAEYFEVDGDSWTHGRMEFDLQLVQAKSIMASYAGRKSGEARKGTTVERPFDEKGTTVQNAGTTVHETLNHKRMNEQIKEQELVQISFERFWDVYPRKQGKAKAKSAFEKAIKSIEIEALIEAVTRYAKDPNRQDQFTKMPETYLNGQCWNDAALPQRALTKSGGFAVPSGPTPTPPRFTASEVTQGIEMPENIRQIALGRSN